MDLAPLKILFLDVGGVLLTNGWGHESRQRAAEQFGFDYLEMDVLHDFMFNTYEIGRITLDEYLDTSRANLRGRILRRLCFRSRWNCPKCCNG
jgi:putative hydrolase of the HAD superfamily